MFADIGSRVGQKTNKKLRNAIGTDSSFAWIGPDKLHYRNMEPRAKSQRHEFSSKAVPGSARTDYLTGRGRGASGGVLPPEPQLYYRSL
jgi:hypothetical protein